MYCKIKNTLKFCCAFTRSQSCSALIPVWFFADRSTGCNQAISKRKSLHVASLSWTNVGSSRKCLPHRVSTRKRTTILPVTQLVQKWHLYLSALHPPPLDWHGIMAYDATAKKKKEKKEEEKKRGETEENIKRTKMTMRMGTERKERRKKNDIHEWKRNMNETRKKMDKN